MLKGLFNGGMGVERVFVVSLICSLTGTLPISYAMSMKVEGPSLST